MKVMIKIKHFSGGLRFSKLFFFFIVGLLFVSSCRQDSRYQQIKRYFNEIHHYTLHKDQIIIVISNNGCMHCNRSFASNNERYIENRNITFLITADGNYLDISNYMNRKNVFFDNKKLLSDYNIPDKTKFIVIKDEKIDTVVNIAYNKLTNQVNFLDSIVTNSYDKTNAH